MSFALAYQIARLMVAATSNLCPLGVSQTAPSKEYSTEDAGFTRSWIAHARIGMLVTAGCVWLVRKRKGWRGGEAGSRGKQAWEE